MAKTRRNFSKEFKIEAVKLVTEGDMSITQVARDLDLSRSLLARWKRELGEDAEAFPGKGHQSPEKEENVWLRRRVMQLEQERDILKKAMGYFAKDPE